MYQIFKSNRKNKKYMAVFKDGRIIHFGDIRYQQFKDTTDLKLYSILDHLDPNRRRLFHARHKDSSIYSPTWFAKKYLW